MCQILLHFFPSKCTFFYILNILVSIKSLVPWKVFLNLNKYLNIMKARVGVRFVECLWCQYQFFTCVRHWISGTFCWGHGCWAWGEGTGTPTLGRARAPRSLVKITGKHLRHEASILLIQLVLKNYFGIGKNILVQTDVASGLIVQFNWRMPKVV